MYDTYWYVWVKLGGQWRFDAVYAEHSFALESAGVNWPDYELLITDSEERPDV